MNTQTKPQNETSKQIWRTWNGDTTKSMEFIKDVTAIAFNDGFVLNMIKHSQYLRSTFLWEHLKGSGTKIVAYTTDHRSSLDYILGEYTKTTNNQ